MITKFKLYEKINIGIKDVKPKEGDYVIMTLDYIVDEGDQQQGIDIIRKCRKHIQNNIGEVSYYNDSDTVVITYKNLPMDGNIVPSKDVSFDTQYIIYWSKNKKELKEKLEELLITKKYNL